MLSKLNILKEPVNQNWTIERIAREAPPFSWENVFRDSYEELKYISEILEERVKTHGEFYPLKKDIFAAFNHTQLKNVKVVILGQDPYPQTIFINGQAVPRTVGLSFSVRIEDSIPSSLQNIYKEMTQSVKGFARPDHGDLTDWAKQGVLLLNTCLTVEPGKPGSHGDDLWAGFIYRVFNAIAQVNPHCVFMLWGRKAQDMKKLIGQKSVFLEAAHPSGLSANRGFFGCNHFNLANRALMRHGQTPINWNLRTRYQIYNPVYYLATPTLNEDLVEVNPHEVNSIIENRESKPKNIQTDVKDFVRFNKSPDDKVSLIPTIPPIPTQ